MAVDQFRISETMKEAHAIAVILARGYLRWRSVAIPEPAEKPNLPAYSACLAVSSEIRVSVPCGLRRGEALPPQIEHVDAHEEADEWNWI